MAPRNFLWFRHGGSLYKPARALLSLVILGTSPLWAQEAKPLGPPKTRTNNVTDKIHGVQVVDRYRWLEDQESPETRAWIDAENSYTQFLLSTWPGREALKRRLGELMKIDTIEVESRSVDGLRRVQCQRDPIFLPGGGTLGRARRRLCPP